MVPMSSENGAGLMRSNRTRVPLAVMVKRSAPLPPLTSAVSLPSPPSNRSVPPPGFQIMQVVAGLAEQLVVAGAAVERVVAVAAEQEVVAALAVERVVAGLAEQQVVARAAGDRVVAVAAERCRRRHRAVGLVDRDGVVAALAENLDYRWCWRRSGVPPDDVDGAAIDQNASGRIATGHDRVTDCVAEHRELSGRRGENVPW